MVVRFALKVYGCQMNQYDADKIRTALIAKGWSEASEDLADAIIFVGCSIRDKAEHKVWSELGRYGKRWSAEGLPLVAVTGCVAQNVGVEMAARYPWVQVISGPRHIGELPDTLELAVASGQSAALLDHDPRAVCELSVAPMERSCSWKAQVMISHGCDNFCTFCIVPYVRGRFASRRPEEVVKEVKALLDDGVKEVTLLGQNVDTYGLDFKDGTSFATLLRDVAELGVPLVRFMTSYPTDFTADVVSTIASHANICPSINLPIQAGSDRILKAMNRRYNLAEYTDVVQRIRDGLPEVGLTSDLIVGFPGETEEDFQESLEALRRFRFDQVHSAAYSPRQGTPAAKMKDQLTEEEKKRRLNLVNDLQLEIARSINEELVGRQYRVLVDGPANKGALMQGRTTTDKVVLFEGQESWAGRFVTLEIIDANSWSLKGRFLSLQD